MLKKYSHSNVLEVGCGLESVAVSFDNFDSWTIVEPSDVFLSQVRQTLAGRKNIKYVYGLLEDSTEALQTQSYDYIIVSSLLHEVNEPGQLLRAIFQVCGDGATVHVNVPNAKSFHRLLAYESGLIQSVGEFSEKNRMLQQHTVFDLTSLEETIKSEAKTCEMEAEILERGSFFVKPFAHKQMSEVIRCGVIDEKILDGLDGMVKYMPDLGAEIYVNCRVKPIRGAVTALNCRGDIMGKSDKKEVKGMLLTEYNEAKTMELFKEEGRAEGKAEGRAEIVRRMLAANMPYEQIAELTDLPIEQILILRS